MFRENLLPPSAAAHHMATCRVIIAWHKTKHFADTVTAADACPHILSTYLFMLMVGIQLALSYPSYSFIESKIVFSF